jgi:hypothetical protein
MLSYFSQCQGAVPRRPQTQRQVDDYHVACPLVTRMQAHTIHGMAFSPRQSTDSGSTHEGILQNKSLFAWYDTQTPTVLPPRVIFGNDSIPLAISMASSILRDPTLLANAVLLVKRASRPEFRMRCPRSDRSEVAGAGVGRAPWAAGEDEDVGAADGRGAWTGWTGVARRANNAVMLDTEGNQFRLFWRSNLLRYCPKSGAGTSSHWHVRVWSTNQSLRMSCK